MKHKQNQGFSTFDFFTMTASLAVIFVISGPILKKNMEVGNIDKALRETRNLAFELLHDEKFQNLRVASYVAQPKKRESRGIASIQDESAWAGGAKKDPWGKPYNFRFLRNTKGMPVAIVVWSNGPEERATTDIKISNLNGVEQLELGPDAIVAQVPLR